jgi:hypothetical protein
MYVCVLVGRFGASSLPRPFGLSSIIIFARREKKRKGSSAQHTHAQSMESMMIDR